MTADVDPRPWAEAANGLSSAGLVLATVVIVLGFILLIWRGSDRLGVPGAGVEIRLHREALEKRHEAEKVERAKERDAFLAHVAAAQESDRRMRNDLRTVFEWFAQIADRLGLHRPDIEEGSEPAIVLPAPTRGASSPDLRQAGPSSRTPRRAKG